MEVSSILVWKKSQYRLPESWVTIESDGLKMSDGEILLQNWFNKAHSAKLWISINNRLSNRCGPPIIDVKIPGRFPSLLYTYHIHIFNISLAIYDHINTDLLLVYHVVHSPQCTFTKGNFENLLPFHKVRWPLFRITHLWWKPLVQDPKIPQVIN